MSVCLSLSLSYSSPSPTPTLLLCLKSINISWSKEIFFKDKERKYLFRVKNGQSGLFCSKKRKRWWMESARAGISLPACHTSSTADVYIFHSGSFTGVF